MSVKGIPPRTSLLYSKTGACRGITSFLTLTSTHNLCFGAKIRKIYKFSADNFQFLKLKKSLFIAWVFVMDTRKIY